MSCELTAGEIPAMAWPCMEPSANHHGYRLGSRPPRRFGRFIGATTGRMPRLPEMWKTRPVIVISYKNTLTGPCLVVPVSSDPQDNNRWAHRLSIEVEGNGVTSWAVCNHPATLSPSRFTQFNQGIPLLPKDDFNQVLERLIKWLPIPFPLDT